MSSKTDPSSRPEGQKLCQRHRLPFDPKTHRGCVRCYEEARQRSAGTAAATPDDGTARSVRTPLAQTLPAGSPPVRCERHARTFDPTRYRGCAQCYEEARARAKAARPAAAPESEPVQGVRTPLPRTLAAGTPPVRCERHGQVFDPTKYRGCATCYEEARARAKAKAAAQAPATENTATNVPASLPPITAPAPAASKFTVTAGPPQTVNTPLPSVWPARPEPVKVLCHRHKQEFDPTKYRGCAQCYQEARERAERQKARAAVEVPPTPPPATPTAAPPAAVEARGAESPGDRSSASEFLSVPGVASAAPSAPAADSGSGARSSSFLEAGSLSAPVDGSRSFLGDTTPGSSAPATPKTAAPRQPTAKPTAKPPAPPAPVASETPSSEGVIGLARPRSFAEVGDDQPIGLAKPRSFAEVGDDQPIGLAKPQSTEPTAAEGPPAAVPPGPPPDSPEAEAPRRRSQPLPRPAAGPTLAPPEPASVKQGLVVAAVLILIGGFGIFVEHKKQYEVFQEFMNTPAETGAIDVEHFGSTSEEAGELPPEVRELLEGSDYEGYDYGDDEDYEGDD